MATTTTDTDLPVVAKDPAMLASLTRDQSSLTEFEVAAGEEGRVKSEDGGELDWDDDPNNPFNWPVGKKAIQLLMLNSTALLASMGSSIISPAHDQLMEEFGVSGTAAIVPLTTFSVALGFGPVLGGPISETVGRQPVFQGAVPLGALFTLGAGFTHNFGALCFLRFMAGLCWGPVLAVSAGSLSETFRPQPRGPAAALYILVAFMGPGLAPVIGAFAVSRKGWRWTQWTLLFCAVLCMATTLLSKETFRPVIERRLAKKRGKHVPPRPSVQERLKQFVLVDLKRPIHMMFFEPIVAFICLYVAVEFGTLFSFFAAVPYTFGTVYHFSVEQSGLVFLSIVIGSFLGMFTVMVCDILIYRPQASKYPPHKIPPEYRLPPSMIGCFGLPIGLFWFGWTAKAGISWASPAFAMVPFAWGNICLFLSGVQYMADTYHGNVVASATSANSVARYGLAGIFPLFTIQMYERLGIGWASSLLGFIAFALLPVPWVFFKFGPRLRAQSKYETIHFETL